MALTKVSTPAIKDEAITLAKLLHGDSNSNGKFLRANNGADPSFETIDLTALSASNLTSGTLPDARFPSALPAISGANLTNLDASDLASGTVPDARFPATLPAVSAANLTNIPAANITGTLPAIDGSNLTGITSVTINSQSDNRVITATGTTDTLQSESNFLHDATNCDTTIQGYEALKVVDLIVKNTNPFGNAAGARITIESGSAANTGPQFGMICGSDNWYLQTPKNVGALDFHKNGTRYFRLMGDGHVQLSDGDLVLANGHGIDFSADAHTSAGGASMSNELFDDYEEGTWTPFYYAWIGGGVPATVDYAHGTYTKIGNTVHITFDLKADRGSMNHNYITVGGLPFAHLGTRGGWATIPWAEHAGGENSTSSTRGHGLEFGGGATVHGWLTAWTSGAGNQNHSPTYLSTSYMSNTNHTRIRGFGTYFTTA